MKRLQLKMKQINGVFVIEYDGGHIVFTKLRAALEYVLLRKKLAHPYEVTTSHNDTMYPVNSLLPPVVKKMAYFYDLGAEII